MFYCNYASIMHRNAMTDKDAIAISTSEPLVQRALQVILTSKVRKGGYVIPRVFHCNFASLVYHFVSI